jgi:N-acetyl-gamma-glutamyl-phosphate reductase
MHKIPIGVLGASGYAGRTLCALAGAHERLELAWAAAGERRGESVRIDGRPIRFVGIEDAPLGEAALVFSALPHGASAPWVARARAAGARVIDLSADLRPGADSFGDESASAGTAGLRSRVAYGLTELARGEVRSADVVANPGCYATAVLLALIPLLASGLVTTGTTVTVTAASGVTGAGDGPRRDLLFAEVTENFRAYAVGNTHRHLAEMRAVCARFGADVDLVFTPHLLPVARGILATVTVPIVEAIADPIELWRTHYRNERFVEVVPESPSLRDVVYRNVARISVAAAALVRRPTLVITAAIDNLLKGAAGQALQNANVLLGLEEAVGLPT